MIRVHWWHWTLSQASYSGVLTSKKLTPCLFLWVVCCRKCMNPWVTEFLSKCVFWHRCGLSRTPWETGNAVTHMVQTQEDRQKLPIWVWVFMNNWSYTQRLETATFFSEMFIAWNCSSLGNSFPCPVPNTYTEASGCVSSIIDFHLIQESMYEHMAFLRFLTNPKQVRDPVHMTEFCCLVLVLF